MILFEGRGWLRRFYFDNNHGNYCKDLILLYKEIMTFNIKVKASAALLAYWCWECHGYYEYVVRLHSGDEISIEYDQNPNMNTQCTPLV